MLNDKIYVDLSGNVRDFLQQKPPEQIGHEYKHGVSTKLQRDIERLKTGPNQPA